MTSEVLTTRRLNRATLTRQLLLERSALTPVDAVAHLVGLQAQVPHDPYLALWSRLEAFDPEVLSRAIEHRELVRIVVMRGTIHLVTAEDCVRLRPHLQPVLDGELARHRDHAPHLVDVDLAPVLAFAAERLAERPLTFAQLRLALADRFPEQNPAALAYACRNHLPLVQLPPRGLWKRSAQVTYATADAWLGPTDVAEVSIDDIVLRYLAAFGPATVADVTTWCRLTGLRAVVERLRPRLRTFRDERGRELFDLPDAPRPDPDVPAPVRFLPEYDNVLLSHADRSRFASDGWERLWTGDRRMKGTVLADGVVVATTSTDRPKRKATATLTVDHLPDLPKKTLTDIEAEADRAIRFLEPDANSHEVRLVPVA